MRARLLVLLLCLIGGPLAVEGIMRFLLFHPGEFATWQGRGLRHAALFADPQTEQEYWRLEWELRTSEKVKMPPYDELLGWTNRRIEPGTYDYLPEVELAGRRPILLYGASYTDCVTGPEECFQTLLEESPLGAQYALLNYGVGGHGCGQTLTLMRETLDRHAARNPVVVIGLVADSDFTRCTLEFRSWPKLKLVRDGSELVPAGPVPAGGPVPYMEAHGVGIFSYAWRYLLHAPSQVPVSWQRALNGTEQLRAEQDELIRDIVLAMRAELDARGLQYFFLLFTSMHGLPPAPTPHEESLLLELFREQQIPHISARNYLRRALQEPDVELGTLFLLEGIKRNHPNLNGNRLMFEALARGLDGQFRPARRNPTRSEDRVDEGRDDRRGLQDDEHDRGGQQQDDDGSEPPVGTLPEGDE